MCDIERFEWVFYFRESWDWIEILGLRRRNERMIIERIVLYKDLKCDNLYIGWFFIFIDLNL